MAKEFKKRKKAGSVANFFETMAEDPRITVGEKIASLKKIYKVYKAEIAPQVQSIQQIQHVIHAQCRQQHNRRTTTDLERGSMFSIRKSLAKPLVNKAASIHMRNYSGTTSPESMIKLKINPFISHSRKFSRLQFPEQGCEKVSRKVSTITPTEGNEMEENYKESQNKSRNRTEYVSKTQTLLKRRRKYELDKDKIKANPLLRRCASLNTHVGAKLKNYPTQTPIVNQTTVQTTSRKPRRISFRKSEFKKYIIHRSSLLQSRVTNADLYYFYVDIKLRPEYYNRIYIRDVLKQIKHDFKYQKESCFEADARFSSFQYKDKQVMRSLDYCVSDSNGYSPIFTKNLYLYLRNLFIRYKAEEVHSVIDCIRFSSYFANVPVPEELQYDIEDSGYSEAFRDLSYGEDERKMMTEDIKMRWYSEVNSLQIESSNKRILMKRPERMVTQRSQESKHMHQRLIKKLRGYEIVKVPKWNKRRRPSDKNMFLHLEQKENKGQTTERLCNITMDEDTANVEEASEVVSDVNLYKQLLKDRINQLLTDFKPIDLKLLERPEATENANTQRFSAKISSKMKPIFNAPLTASNLEYIAKKFELDTAPSEPVEESQELSCLLQATIKHLDNPYSITTSTMEPLKVSQSSVLEIGNEVLPGNNQLVLQKISSVLRELLLKSLDTYTYLITMPEYLSEGKYAGFQRVSIRKAGELATEENICPENFAHIIGNERITFPFILDGCRGLKPSSVKRICSQKNLIINTPRPDPFEEKKESVFYWGRNLLEQSSEKVSKIRQESSRELGRGRRLKVIQIRKHKASNDTIGRNKEKPHRHKRLFQQLHCTFQSCINELRFPGRIF
eukprot:TRINITY_DN160_c0_g1_i1.p1 TRINITY_DN160_c0_g1~~TRINITY_DN160_c0_g1_i1.p1  ORF type:complete len:844 (-),score=49.95 TRINITY_DN160_c0_g1_i1:6392-8923(-)